MTTTIDGTLGVTTPGITNTGTNSSTGNVTGGNFLTGGVVSAAGSITGSYIYGNGSQLSGIITSVSSLSNGTSNVTAVSSGGNITVGVGGTANVAVFSTLGANIAGNTTSNNITITTSLAVGNTTPTGTAGQIVATNSITAFYSDRRLKQNIVPIPNALDKVDRLSGVTYTQNEFAEQFGYNDYSQQVGVIAQQVQEVLPEVVKLAPFDMGPGGTSRSGENYLTVQYEKIVPLLVEAIKELRAEVEKLKGLK